MPIEHAARAGIKQATRYLGRRGGKVIKNITFEDAIKGLQPKTRKVLDLSRTTNNGELLPNQVRTMQDTFSKNTEEGLEFLEELEDGVLNNNWNNFGGHLSDASRKADQDFQGAAIENSRGMQLEQSSTKPLSSAPPTRYDVSGPEGKKELRTSATPWWQEQMEEIGWNPDRSGEIDRSAFAPEGMFIDGEQYRWQGVTQYARDRKTVPTLTKVKQSVSKINRHENELAQTYGPKVRAKPELVDLLGDVVPSKDVHQHHVLLLSVLEPWTRKADGSLRDKKQLKQLFTALSKKDWWTGNVDKNLVWQNVNTHFQDAMSSHKQLIGSTDIQGRPVGEKFVEGFGPTEIPGKTFTPDAMHGFSDQFIENLSKETDTKKLIKSLLLFLEEGGGGEAMEGAAYSAQKNLEPRAKIKGKDVESGDILADRRLQNPRVQKNVERFEAGRDSLKKGK